MFTKEQLTNKRHAHETQQEYRLRLRTVRDAVKRYLRGRFSEDHKPLQVGALSRAQRRALREEQQ